MRGAAEAGPPLTVSSMGNRPRMERAPTRRMPRAFSSRVQPAIEAGQIYVDLQPIVDLQNGSVYAYEALARCEVAELATPLQLLSAASQQGVLGLLGRELRRCAVATAAGARLFVNIHPDELDQECLSRPDDPIYGYDGEVFVELPESAPLVRYRFARSTLGELRSRGIRVAIDDFGAGYSNLSYIADLAPDVVKLDRELVLGTQPGSRRHKLLASLAALCAAQGAVVVAEGIERQSELAAVSSAGIPLAQGYLLGRPQRSPSLR